MDDGRFDALARAWGTPTSRRDVTKTVLGWALAALGLSLGLAAETRAKPKKNKKKKPKKCKNGAVKCGNACVDTRTNAQHCGGCGRPCPSGQSCAEGQCQAGGCPGDRELCGTECVNLADDEAHCGQCNNACGGDLTCIDGACGCAAGTRCGNSCVDLDEDDAHCGACDHACQGDLTCMGGTCDCASGTKCDTDCVNIQTDRNHCGGCDDACDPGQTCSGGECVAPPECTSQAQCGGSSFNDLVCRNGRCVCATEGEGICNRFPDGRGSCHECCPGGSGVCPRDEVCHVEDSPPGVVAVCACPTGWQRCTNLPAGTCVADPQRDPQKCGQECRDCTFADPGTICCDGFCTRGCDPGYQCGGLLGACGPNCSLCGPGMICCNAGPGTQPRCKPNTHGGFCYVD